MSILGNDLLLGSGDEGYNLTRSLRFRASASAYLSRTFGTPTNNKIWTQSIWVKRGSLEATRQTLLGATFGGAYWILEFDASNRLNIYDSNAASPTTLTTTQIFTDPAAWYHIVVAEDTTQATASNRTKVYVNGVQVTSFVAANYPPQNSNTFWNTSGYPISIASALPVAGLYFDGYLAEFNFIDGQALTPSSFGSTNTLTGVWQPARYTGTYGTNGFYLPFTDNSALTTSSNAGLGKDFSGNGNYWTTNNISITSGVTYDSMTDVPTLTSATAANFAVLNPLDSNLNSGTGALSSANLKLTTTLNDWASSRATISIPSGKWYWEVTRTLGNYGTFGIYVTNAVLSKDVNTSSNYYGYNSNGQKFSGGSGSSYGSSMATGDVIGVAFDASAGSLTFYLNNVSQGVAFTGITGSYSPVVGTFWNTSANDINFGQRPFAYTPPTGFVALNTYNLPTSTIVKGNTVMDATLYSGTGGSQSIVNAGGFKPDLVWTKARSQADQNNLMDSVRGVGNRLFSNLTNAETTGGLVSVNSNGFSINSSSASMNNSGQTYVGWQWQAGQGTTSTNTAGTITSTVSVNATAGFSVVTYTGTGTVGATVGHGLGVTPKWIIVKARSAVQDWRVYTETVGNTGVLTLNDPGAAVTNQSGFWNNTSPTSSVFSLGSAASTNGNGTTYVAYCWAAVPGFSAFGSYTGNGSADGVFVYTGFKPRWVMLKITSGSGGGWIMYDTARKTYNVNDTWLYANDASAENVTPTYDLLDIVSNGFKLRSANYLNVSGDTLIYAAFAEVPFKHSLAR